MANKPSFAKGFDETSIPKRLAAVFAAKHHDQIRFDLRRGWLVRGADEFWRVDPAGALKLACEFCDATARLLRSIAVTGKAMAAEVLRLSEYEPDMRAGLPEGEVLGGWAI
jgi:hypothetical protein